MQFLIILIQFYLPSDTPELPWAIGDYVAVYYGGEKYPGVVTQIVNSETEVDCMVKSGQYWKWPPEKDLIWYSPQDILTTISKPVPASHRGQMKFADF